MSQMNTASCHQCVALGSDTHVNDDFICDPNLIALATNSKVTTKCHIDEFKHSSIMHHDQLILQVTTGHPECALSATTTAMCG